MGAVWTWSELTDMHLCLGLARGDAAEAKRLYLESHPDRDEPQQAVFTAVDRSLRATGRLPPEVDNTPTVTEVSQGLVALEVLPAIVKSEYLELASFSCPEPPEVSGPDQEDDVRPFESQGEADQVPQDTLEEASEYHVESKHSVSDSDWDEDREYQVAPKHSVPYLDLENDSGYLVEPEHSVSNLVWGEDSECQVEPKPSVSDLDWSHDDPPGSSEDPLDADPFSVPPADPPRAAEGCDPQTARNKRTDAGKRLFECEVCGKTFTKHFNFRRHRIDVHKEKDASSESQTTGCDPQTAINVRTDEGKRQFKCEVCDKIFPKIYNLRRHQSTHEGKDATSPTISESERSLECEVCGMTFTKIFNLRRHRSVHGHKVKKQIITCEQCGKVFKEESHLEYHKAAKHVPKQVPEEAAQQNQLNNLKTGGEPSRPIRDNCGTVVENGSDLKVDKLPRNACSECGKSFKWKQGLERHMLMVHSSERPFVCSECGKSFKWKHGHERHMAMVHTREKPFVCSVCMKAFFGKGALKIHMRLHTGEKPYVCSECKKGFNEKANYIYHMRTHTGEKPYQCSDCGMAFRRKFQLKIHIRSHTGEKPYVCSQCGSAFVRSSHLYKHMRHRCRAKP